jgi:hypothetical protein
MPPKEVVVRGLVAGLIGGTILAAWFLIIDAIQGQPFHTPAFLARILLHVDGADRSFAGIALYTVVHYAAFGVVGVAVAWLMNGLGTLPTILLGLVLGFVLFDVVFYLGIAVTGVDVVDELGWAQVLSGNLVAGVGVLGYLHLKLGVPSVSWQEALSRHPVFREGVVAGVLAAVAVAVWFLIIDLVRGQMFFTPGALGSALFLRVADGAAVQVNLVTVAGYSVVHFAAFVAVGIAAAGIACQAEKTPSLLVAGVLIYATFEALFLGLLAIAAEWLLGALGWLSIGVGNLIATVVIAYFLWREHPKLRAALRQPNLAEENIDLS